MVDLFKVSDPSEALGNTITAREILDKGAPASIGAGRPAGDPGDPHGYHGHGLHQPGPYEPALHSCARDTSDARTVGRTAPGGGQQPDAPGRGADAQSSYDEAEQRLREALRIRRTLFGDTSAEVANTISALVETLGKRASTRRRSH